MKLKPDMVYTMGMGIKAFNLFKEKNIKLKTGNYQTFKEVIDNINNLEDFNENKAH